MTSGNPCAIQTQHGQFHFIIRRHSRVDSTHARLSSFELAGVSKVFVRDEGEKKKTSRLCHLSRVSAQKCARLVTRDALLLIHGCDAPKNRGLQCAQLARNYLCFLIRALAKRPLVKMVSCVVPAVLSGWPALSGAYGDLARLSREHTECTSCTNEEIKRLWERGSRSGVSV